MRRRGSTVDWSVRCPSHPCLWLTTAFRLIKEVAFYQDEVKENEKKLQEMMDHQKDEHDIKKFKEVLGESHMMVPDSEKRLKQALGDLRDFCASGAAPTDGEWWETAQAVLAEHGQLVDGDDDIVHETKLDDLVDGEAF